MSRDIDLLIRARDQASRAANAVAAALRGLDDAQTDVGRSAAQTDNLLGRLGQHIVRLDGEIKALSSFEKLARSLDQTAAAIDRLESHAGSVSQDLGRISTAQQKAAADAGRLRSEANALSASLEAQKEKLREVSSAHGRNSAAYRDQAAVVDKLKTSFRQADGAAKAAEKTERKLSATVRSTTDDLVKMQADLGAANDQFEEMYRAAQEASGALGGLAASQEAINARLAAAKANMSDAGAKAALLEEAQAAERAKNALAEYALINERAGIRTGPAKSARESAAVFEEMAAKAQRLKAFIDPAAVAQDRFNREVAEAQMLQKMGLLSAVEYGKVHERLTAQLNAATGAMDAQGRRKGSILFGLRPYEIQNLSYQVNDLITQIASGTPITQAFAQQFGQIFQLFPRLGAGIAGVIPQVVAMGGALAFFLTILKRVHDQNSTARQFGGILSLDVNRVATDARAIAEIAHRLDVYGASLKKVREELKIFVREGIDVSHMERMGRTAQNLSDVLGGELADNARKIAEAFSNGFAAVDEFDREMQFLSSTERQRIRDLFESGEAEDARRLAFDLFARKVDEAAAKMQGPWQRTVRALTGAWDSFLNLIGTTPAVRKITGELQYLAQVLDYISGRVAGAEKTVSESVLESTLRRLRLEEAQLEAKQIPNPRTSAERLEAAAEERKLEAVRGRIRQAESQLEGIRGSAADTRASQAEAERKAIEDILTLRDEELATINATTDAQRIALAGERARREEALKGSSQAVQTAARDAAIIVEQTRINNERRRQASQEAARDARRAAEEAAAHAAAIAEANEERQFELDLLSRTNREQAIARALRQAEKPELSDPARPGASLAEAERLSIEATTAALFDKEEELRRIQAVDQARLALAEEMGELLDREAFVANALRQAKLDLTTEEGREVAEIQRRLFDLRETQIIDQARLDLARALGQELSRQQFIEQAARQANIKLASKQGKIFEELQGQIYDREQAEKRTQEAEQRINDLLERRRLIQEQIKAAQDRGDNGTVEQLESQVDDVNESLRTAIDNALAFWEALGGPESENAILRLRALIQELDAFGQKVALTVTQADEMLANAGVNFFDAFAQGVAQGESALDSLLNSIRQTVASLAGEISQMVLKAILLEHIMRTKLGERLSGSVNALSGAGPLIGAAVALRGAGETLRNAASPLIGAAAAIARSAAQLMAATHAAAAANASSTAGLFHTGGIAGRATMTRRVPNIAFVGAMRYHVGGIAGRRPGLRPGEVPAILEEGEEILSRSSPRHAKNLVKSGGSSGRNLRIINLFDPGEALAQALATPAGERAILNHISERAGEFRTAIE